MNEDHSELTQARPLLAKSSKNGRQVSLLQHSVDVFEASQRLFSPDSRLSKSWVRFFATNDVEAFHRHLQIAALFHDLGKANDAFLVDVVRGGFSQPIRHEHLSALVLCLRTVREWLSESRNIDFDAIAGAVLSHHLKASDSTGDWPWGQFAGNPSLRVHLEHAEVEALFVRIGALAGLSGQPEIPKDNWPKGAWEEAWSWGNEKADALKLAWARRPGRDESRNLHLSIKAGLIAADALGSAIRREQRDLDEFLSQTIHRPSLSKSQIWLEIIEPRIREIQGQGKVFAWDPFQEAADELPERAALVAACGAGKTMAAWRWAAAMAERLEIGSVIFLYPTRATATEGFKDYVAWAPESRLLTGTAKTDLVGMMQNPPESLKGKQIRNLFEDEREARMFALANWRYPFFSATLDQFLSFLEHSYSGLCLLPQFADAAVIVDEAHSLDRHLFERLQALITHFQGPLLLMSASLPRERKEALLQRDVRIFPADEEREFYRAMVEEEERGRYCMLRCPCLDKALVQVEASEQVERRSTLWVVNTVRRCQELALRLMEKGGAPLVYHSRFRARDRRSRHDAVVTAFKGGQGSQPWAITTQVCEMSLDLDADRLVTEDAPLSSLIQRLGRANRSRARDRTFRAEVITYAPKDQRPYDLESEGGESLRRAARFAYDFDGKELSQRELALALQDPRYAIDAPLPRAWAGFLCEGWFAATKPLRGEEGSRDVRCVLDSDLALGLGADGMDGDPLEAWVVNVPQAKVLKGFQRPEWLAARNLHVADGRLYRPDLGFLLMAVEV